MSRHHDAELLTLCATVQAVQDEIEAGYPFEGKKGELRLSKLSDRSWGAAAKASVCQAITAEGRLAKAAMALRMLDIEPECHHEQGAVIAMRALRSLLQDADADRDLISACTEFDVLERRQQHIYNVEFSGDDAAADAAAEALAPAQYAALARICAKPATTLEGHRALAATLLLENIPLAAQVKDNEDDFVNLRLLNALLRGLSPGCGA